MLSEGYPETKCSWGSSNRGASLTYKFRSMKPIRPTYLMNCYPKHTQVGEAKSCEFRLDHSFLKFSVSFSCGYWVVALEHERRVPLENFSIIA